MEFWHAGDAGSRSFHVTHAKRHFPAAMTRHNCLSLPQDLFSSHAFPWSTDTTHNRLGQINRPILPACPTLPILVGSAAQSGRARLRREVWRGIVRTKFRSRRRPNGGGKKKAAAVLVALEDDDKNAFATKDDEEYGEVDVTVSDAESELEIAQHKTTKRTHA
jgi:hypothetical protein